MDYAALTEAVRTGLARAKEVCAATDDGGTCNMDSALLIVGRKSRKVEEAVKAGGGMAFHRRGRGYILSPRVRAQGFARTAAAKALRDTLTEAGFDMGMWYQMD
jgi:hypothetical protein